LSTIGYSYFLVSFATFDFSSKVRVLGRKSFSSRVESWNESCICPRPPSLNAAMLLGEADARGDEGDVVAELRRLGREHLAVIAHERLAAREAELHGAELARLAESTQPVFSRYRRGSCRRLTPAALPIAPSRRTASASGR
jgi:hypothetical protein